MTRFHQPDAEHNRPIHNAEEVPTHDQPEAEQDHPDPTADEVPQQDQPEAEHDHPVQTADVDPPHDQPAAADPPDHGLPRRSNRRGKKKFTCLDLENL